MNRLVAATVTLFGLLGSIAGPVRAEVTAEQVRKAIDRGANYLLEQQLGDGSWPEMIGYRGGVSALCTLALLNAGVEADDQRMQKALDYLRTIRPEKTYVVALQTIVLARAEPDRDRELILRNVKWLQSTQIIKGLNKGAWTYPDTRGTKGDQSNSQFALLALHEAERVGVVAKELTWRLAKGYWVRGQNADGSWGYLGSSIGTGSMTCAGITSLVIAADRVQPSDARAVGDRVECCLARPARGADRIERGFRWLGEHYSVEQNPNEPTWTLYYLYGLERAGRLTARRFIPLPSRPGQPSRADWYREGADHLIRNQDSVSGAWRGVRGGENRTGMTWTHWEEPLIGTSFALLFLSKGRWPVLLGKLQHGGGNDWNRHRSDVGNLTRYVESRWKLDLTWQVIDLKLASVDDLIQTPVLYLCGSRSPLIEDPAQRKALAQKLRDYLDRGGFLFGEAYCRGTEFDKGFRELMARVFPEPEYRLRLLPPEHPIWRTEERVDADKLRPLEGVDFGCRTSVVYSPPDSSGKVRPSLSCLWELSRPGRGQKYEPAVQDEVDAGLSIGINVLAYATNRQLKYKEQIPRHLVKRTGDDSHRRGTIHIANLRHPGGCRSAPRALANLMEAASEELKIRAEAEEDDLDLTDDALFDYHLVFMHGRNSFRLTAAERTRLRTYVERGGLLFANAICASKAFAESFRREMAIVFPDQPLKPIPVADPLFTPDYGGYDLSTVTRRDPQRGTGSEPFKDKLSSVAPDLEGIRLEDRYGVIFSPYDLSCALEQQNTLECQGYVRQDAARIGLNVLLYSLQQ